MGYETGESSEIEFVFNKVFGDGNKYFVSYLKMIQNLLGLHVPAKLVPYIEQNHVIHETIEEESVSDECWDSVDSENSKKGSF